jgi:hypothetical protein
MNNLQKIEEDKYFIIRISIINLNQNLNKSLQTALDDYLTLTVCAIQAELKKK